MRLLPVLLVGAALAAPGVALAEDAALEKIETDARDARDEGHYLFCRFPKTPLARRQRELCAFAPEVDSCEALAKACHEAATPARENWLERLLERLANFAELLLYVFVAGVIVLVALPVVYALRRRRQDHAVTDAGATPNRAVRVPPDEPTRDPIAIADPESALGLADAHRLRGELEPALTLYLAAALAALERRGALAVGRAAHRTNGEYVRSCTDAALQAHLREIVRAVEQTTFGARPPTEGGTLRVSRVARAIVQAFALASFALLLGGCGPLGGGADPASDELPRGVLAKSGFHVRSLDTAIATLPLPTSGSAPPLLVLDAERVALEGGAGERLLAWVRSGGHLLLFDSPGDYPQELTRPRVPADGRELVVGALPRPIAGAAVARPMAISAAEDDDVLATIGGRPYAIRHTVGEGTVVVVANDDLFTNLGAARRWNPSALVAIARFAADGEAGELRVARVEDGVEPPTNPFRAIMVAGLGRGMLHALGAAVILFLAFGIRHARPRPVAAEPSRRAFAEHVAATGALWAKARVDVEALAAYGALVELRLRESLPRGGDLAVALAARGAVSVERARELLERAAAAAKGAERRGDERQIIAELVRALGLHRR